MAKSQAFRRPYVPNTHVLQSIDGSYEFVDTEELDTVSEFLDNYEPNAEKQLGYSNRIIPIERLLD